MVVLITTIGKWVIEVDAKRQQFIGIEEDRVLGYTLAESPHRSEIFASDQSLRLVVNVVVDRKVVRSFLHFGVRIWNAVLLEVGCQQPQNRDRFKPTLRSVILVLFLVT